MNKQYGKQFVLRGMAFGGFGPIVMGVVFWCLSASIEGFVLTGLQVLLATVSTYVIAFVQAGASVFHQIEEWPLAKSLACHFGSLYAVYVGAYLLNSWIPFDLRIIGVFTAIFVGVYAAVWLTVVVCINIVSKRCNARL